MKNRIILPFLMFATLLLTSCSREAEPMQSGSPTDNINAELDQMFMNLGARMTMRLNINEEDVYWRSKRTEDSAFPIFKLHRPGKNPRTGQFQIWMERFSDSHDNVGRREYRLSRKKGPGKSHNYFLESWEYDWEKQTNYGTVLIQSVEEMELAMTKFYDRIDQYDHADSNVFADEYHTRDAIHEVMQGF